MTRRRLDVLETGPLALVEDAGRPGLADLGVSRSGAADRRSFALGARLLAQDETYAAIEVTFGGLSVRAGGDLLVALTGAPAPATVHATGGSERGIGFEAPFRLRHKETLTLGSPTAGLRSYLSVRGGIDVPAELGSRSTDVLSGLGPARLEAGDVLPIGPAPAAFPSVDQAPVEPIAGTPLRLHVIPGPRDDWLADLAELTRTRWTVCSDSDRVGVRLTGGQVRYRSDKQGADLPSEGVVRGAIQIPSGGEPVLFLADHPVTGGYPVVGVIAAADVDRLAQAVPGQEIVLTMR